MKLLVIGGGIAGASAAYFAARRGWAVTLLDAGEGRSSDVPAALLNPVRGQSGKVETQALEGLRCTWALIRALEAQATPFRTGRPACCAPCRTQRPGASGRPICPPNCRILARGK